MATTTTRTPNLTAVSYTPGAYLNVPIVNGPPLPKLKDARDYDGMDPQKRFLKSKTVKFTLQIESPEFRAAFMRIHGIGKFNVSAIHHQVEATVEHIEAESGNGIFWNLYGYIYLESGRSIHYRAFFKTNDRHGHMSFNL